VGSAHALHAEPAAEGEDEVIHREAKNGTPEIEVMTDTMLKPPMHPRKQVKCFGDVSKNDHHQAPSAGEL
jgi:hypothetical protein